MSEHAVVVRTECSLPKEKIFKMKSRAEDSFDSLQLLFSNARLTIDVDEAGLGYGAEAVLATTSGVFQAYSEQMDPELALEESLRTIDALLTNRSAATGGVLT